MERKTKYHFSHPHALDSYETLEHEQIQCSGCNLPASGTLYGCNQCRYFLHEQCRNTDRWMLHPSHIKHDLTLLPRPTYPNASFLCNACGSSGKSFCFSCARCEFDLHIRCALLPPTVVHEDHPEHALTLFFEIPTDDSKIFMCDACHLIVDRRFWVYYCEECDYGIHLGCVISDTGEAPKKSDPTGLAEKQTGTRVVPVQKAGGGVSGEDEEKHQLKQMVEQIMDTELEITRLQNQLTSQIAQLMSWAYR